MDPDAAFAFTIPDSLPGLLDPGDEAEIVVTLLGAKDEVTAWLAVDNDDPWDVLGGIDGPFRPRVCGPGPGNGS